MIIFIIEKKSQETVINWPYSLVYKNNFIDMHEFVFNILFLTFKNNLIPME